jgi:sucrose-6-phosphate hydrolase SacC (GH32 family)
MEFLEEPSMQDFEVCLEAKVVGVQEGNKAEMVLIRIHQHPATLLTYKDCKSWAEGNSLRILALDLLCDLHFKYWFSVDLLAIDWKISPELVRRALLAVRIECPDVTVIERQNTFRMSKETYRRMYPVLNEWNQERMWKE